MSQREYCSRGIYAGYCCKPSDRQGGQVGLARQGAAQATDGVLDATFLPGFAEEGLEAEGMELVMLGELGAVVESNGLTPLRRERAENGRHGVGNRVSFFSRGSVAANRRREWRSWRVSTACPP